jgi:hypothetical protein
MINMTLIFKKAVRRRAFAVHVIRADGKCVTSSCEGAAKDRNIRSQPSKGSFLRGTLTGIISLLQNHARETVLLILRRFNVFRQRGAGNNGAGIR